LFAYVQTLLRLRREHSALAGGRLWHFASDDSAYLFLRESEDERVVVAFNNASKGREFRVLLSDTPAQGCRAVKVLLGDGLAEIAGAEMRVRAPAKSISIFALQD
jgi:glycosidase